MSVYFLSVFLYMQQEPLKGTALQIFVDAKKRVSNVL